MNHVAEMALARARKRGNEASALRQQTPKVIALVTTPAPELVFPIAERAGGHFSRVLYLEGRRHAAEIVRDSRGLLDIPGGALNLISRLRQCMQEKPNSFALGVAEVVKLVEQGVAHG